MEKIYLLLAMLFAFFIGQSLLRSGIRGIRKKHKPFGLYDPRWNVVFGMVGIILGLAFYIKLIILILS